MELQKLQIGFIGSGRITKILLSAWQKKNINLNGILVFDIQPEKSQKLASLYQRVQAVASPTELVEKSDVVFLAVHPPQLPEVLNQIKSRFSDNKFVVSLAPKITIEKIHQTLNYTLPAARVIPNAPCFIGKGYNVFALSEEVNPDLENLLQEMFAPLGVIKKVKEDLLESYATITGMGPTYIWFLFNELYQQALKTGLGDDEAKNAVNEMIKGASETLFKSGLPYEQVLDLIPSYPFKEQEEAIQKIYVDSISKLYRNLKNK